MLNRQCTQLFLFRSKKWFLIARKLNQRRLEKDAHPPSFSFCPQSIRLWEDAATENSVEVIGIGHSQEISHDCRRSSSQTIRQEACSTTTNCESTSECFNIVDRCCFFNSRSHNPQGSRSSRFETITELGNFSRYLLRRTWSGRSSSRTTSFCLPFHYFHLAHFAHFYSLSSLYFCFPLPINLHHFPLRSHGPSRIRPFPLRADLSSSTSDHTSSAERDRLDDELSWNFESTVQ